MSSVGQREQAIFEAGIKFGSLYHQFAGTPVSKRSAASLERAMEESIENQPFCEAVEVSIDPDQLEAALNKHGYTEWTGTFTACELEVVVEDTRVIAGFDRDGAYPEMVIRAIERIDS